MPSNKPLKIDDVLEQQLSDPALRVVVDRVFQQYAHQFRSTFTDVKLAVGNILLRAMSEIAWHQQVGFKGIELAPRTESDRPESVFERADRMEDALNRLENAQMEELRALIADAISRRIVDELRVVIPDALSRPSAYALPEKPRFDIDVPDGGFPVRGQFRNVADAGQRPIPINKQAGKGIGGRAKPEGE